MWSRKASHTEAPNAHDARNIPVFENDVVGLTERDLEVAREVGWVQRRMAGTEVVTDLVSKGVTGSVVDV